MRWIRLREFTPPSEWITKANNAEREISNPELSEDERKALINRRGNIWRELSQEFGSLSNAKCWYCESRQNRSDMPIDHFRPKNNIQGCDHVGYFWLAFDYTNYRYSCTYCNSKRIDQETGESGGKADYFPLFNEDERATFENNQIENEQIVLLDPTNPDDPGCLWFTDDGRTIPKCEDDNSDRYFRAKTSIKLFHLNHSDIRESRLGVAMEIKDKICDGDAYYGSTNEDARRGLRRIKQELVDFIRGSAEYAAYSRSILMGYRDRDWVMEVFQIV